MWAHKTDSQLSLKINAEQHASELGLESDCALPEPRVQFLAKSLKIQVDMEQPPLHKQWA